ncbi:hypothetical protein BW79_18675 [Escherichia coli O119:H4 str. 03-3458]|nr:hypothetical protein BW79_18675 [Escherichia coli O119:H4 str. 03-3458]
MQNAMLQYSMYMTSQGMTRETARKLKPSQFQLIREEKLFKTKEELEEIARKKEEERKALMNPLMILVKIIKLRWIHILSYDQMVSRKINNQTTRCANSIFYTTLFTNSAPNYT